QFQHVAMTYDRASGTTMFFVNGNSVSQTNLGSFIPDTRGNVYLGLRPSGTAGGNRFSGALDEISIYNRSLTSNEVNSIYLAVPLPLTLLPGGHSIRAYRRLSVQLPQFPKETPRSLLERLIQLSF